MVVGSDNPNPVRICMGVPMTSKGTKMESVIDSPFWTNLFDSFMKSIDWRSNRYVFKFYLGFDTKDELYDIGDSWNEVRKDTFSGLGLQSGCIPVLYVLTYGIMVLYSAN